jgi:NADH-quinone oxidoreductase subunit L
MPDLLTILGTVVIAAPVLLLAILGLATIFGHPLAEQSTARAVYLATSLGLAATLGVFILMFTTDVRHVVVSFGDWVHLEAKPPAEAYHFAVRFVFDRLSVPFVALTFVLFGTVGAFATRYMHRESGYNRFFTLYAIFLAGMVLAGLAGTIETLFLGWELVGLASALLVGFFQERPAPVRNALRVWIVYRISDAALLLAALSLHHMSGGGDFDTLTGYREMPGVSPLELQSWPYGECLLSPLQVLVVGGLLIIAAAGKSALIPFSGWLPRAMEGPTPSSAVFYGALSVHLGAYLLLRLDPLLKASPILSIVVLVLGLSTAAYAAICARVQTDIKSALSFASLTQVGLIVAEIGLGWRYIPLVHLIGHACLRTLQFVRAPSLLRDHHLLENAIGERLPRATQSVFGHWLYLFALERGYFDILLDRYIVTPFVRICRWLDRMDRRMTNTLHGNVLPEIAALKPQPQSVDQSA